MRFIMPVTVTAVVVAEEWTASSPGSTAAVWAWIGALVIFVVSAAWVLWVTRQ